MNDQSSSYLAQWMAVIRVGNYRTVTAWKPWAAAIAVLVIIVLASVLAVAVVDLVAGSETGSGGVTAPAGTHGKLGTKDLYIVLVMQVAMIALTVLAASVGRGDVRQTLALEARGIGPRICLAAVAVMFAWLTVYNGLVLLLVPDQLLADLKIYRDVILSPDWWLFTIAILVGAPLSEELLFRGFLQPALAQGRLGFMAAAVLSSLGWALLHWDYTTAGLIEIFLIGLYFCGLLWVTGSILVGIVCHGAYNLVALLLIWAIGGNA